jgi:nucleoside phosphorylase
MDTQQPIAVVVPMEGEFAPYLELLPGMRPLADTGPWEIYRAEIGGRPLVLVISAPGPVNAAAATERMIARFDPAVVLHGGSAGAHDPDLLPGDVVIGARYVIHAPRGVRAAREARGLHPSLIRFRRDGAHVSVPHIDADAALVSTGERVARAELAALGHWTGPGWPVGLPPRPARVVAATVASADAWTVDEGELRELYEHFGAACEDMESAYVAQVGALHRLPFVAVRAISDNEAACQLTPADVPIAIAAAGARAARVIVALVRALAGFSPGLAAPSPGPSLT